MEVVSWTLSSEILLFTILLYFRLFYKNLNYYLHLYGPIVGQWSGHDRADFLVIPETIPDTIKKRLNMYFYTADQKIYLATFIFYYYFKQCCRNLIRNFFVENIMKYILRAQGSSKFDSFVNEATQKNTWTRKWIKSAPWHNVNKIRAFSA